MNRVTRCIPLLALVPALACTVLMRDPEYYHYDVMKALEPREESLKSCYDKALETDDRAAGTVVAAFTVEKKTGVVKDIEVVAEKTTAPTPLAQCATAQLQGLTIETPDAHDGVAEYQWEFILNLDEEELTNEGDPSEAETPPAPETEPKPAPETPAVPGDKAEPGAPAADPEDAPSEPEEPEAEVTFEIGE